MKKDDFIFSHLHVLIRFKTGSTKLYWKVLMDREEIREEVGEYPSLYKSAVKASKSFISVPAQISYFLEVEDGTLPWDTDISGEEVEKEAKIFFCNGVPKIVVTR